MALRQGLRFQTEAARQLIESYDSHSAFCFSSRTRTLLAKGPYAELPGCRSHEVSRLLADLASGGLRNATIVGALPFELNQRARLLLPARLLQAGPLCSDGSGTSSASGPAAVGPRWREHEQQVTHAQFCANVEAALSRIHSGELRKVVLSRTLELEPRGFDVARAVRRLLLANPGGYGFALQLAPAGEDRSAPRTLLGASPELLLEKHGAQVVSHPLAGSAPRSADPVQDRINAERLMASAKDHAEHAIVVDAIVAALRPHCRKLTVRGPALLRTNAMWHLATRVEGQLYDPLVSSLELATVLHPTPAICGDPRPGAQQAIAELETHDRGFFTGMVGWCDASGNGEWAVCIRCALASLERLVLYAGAGIVDGSEAECEWLETGAKLQTVLDALRLDETSRQAGAQG